MGKLDSGLVVADTDLLIDFLRGKGPGVTRIRNWLQTRRLRLTAVTAFELRLGASFMSDAARIRALFNSRTLALDTAGGLMAGEVFATLKRQGREIGVKDCLQAGICLRHDLPLATRNREHFNRIEGLQLYPL